MSHAPTVRNPDAIGNMHEFSYLRWSVQVIGGQSGKKLSGELSSKRRVGASSIPRPNW
jgi:hypothetical protein